MIFKLHNKNIVILNTRVFELFLYFKMNTMKVESKNRMLKMYVTKQ